MGIVWAMRFIVLGEALVDLIPEPGATPAESRWSARSGGGPLNTAVALAELGCDVQFLGRLSEDAFGTQLADHLEAHGVGLDYVIRTFDPTTLAVVSLDEAGKASYAFHTHRTSNFTWQETDFPTLESDDWLHFGSLVAVMEPSFAQVHRYLTRSPNRKSFDINVRPGVLPDRAEYVEKVQALLDLVGQSGGIAKASDEDLAWLSDYSEDPVEMATRLSRKYELSVFLLTLGADGAVAVGPAGEFARVPGQRVDLVDTVGAGDTFNAGFLSRFDGTNVEESLARGVAASALVCTRAGAQPPSAAELDAFLAP